jgi:integrase
MEEIRRMLEVGCQGRLREKAVILLFTSGGGMRIGAIPKLKKCHLKEMSTSTGEKTYGIQIYAESSEDYFTPCSPECANIIDKYLEERAKDGEVIRHDSPLIRNLYNSLSVRNVKPLSIGGLKRILKNALRHSRVRENFDFKGQVKMSRGFRKFYKTEADLSGMVPAAVERTQGHTVGTSSSNTYLSLNDFQILREYEKVIDSVTIDSKHRIEKENAELRKSQNDILAEFDDFRHEFNEMKRLFVHLTPGTKKRLVDEFHEKVGDEADIEWSCK